MITLAVGWVKMNTDVAVRSEVAWVLALVSNDRAVIVGASANRVHFVEPAVVQAAALLASIKLTIDCNYNCVVFESDCSTVVEGQRDELDDLSWDLGRILEDEDCRNLVRRILM